MFDTAEIRLYYVTDDRVPRGQKLGRIAVAVVAKVNNA